MSTSSRLGKIDALTVDREASPESTVAGMSRRGIDHDLGGENMLEETMDFEEMSDQDMEGEGDGTGQATLETGRTSSMRKRSAR